MAQTCGTAAQLSVTAGRGGCTPVVRTAADNRVVLPDVPTQTLRACPRCHATMSHLALQGHTAATVVVDHCAACRLVWFDAFESVELAGLGWVRLLRELQRGLTRPNDAAASTAADATTAAVASLACPQCGSALKEVHNQTRYGRFPALECPQRHGHLHGHAGMLAERGLVRPLLPLERRALAEERRVLDCFACGARSDGSGEHCSYCGSPLLVIDLPRLADALLRRPSDESPSPQPAGVPLAWTCRSCGHPLDPSRQVACGSCRHPVVAPSLVDLNPLLVAIEARLLQAEQAARPYRRKVKRQRTWRETGLGMLERFWRADATEPGDRFSFGLLFAVLFCAWLALALLRR